MLLYGFCVVQVVWAGVHDFMHSIPQAMLQHVAYRGTAAEAAVVA